MTIQQYKLKNVSVSFSRYKRECKIAGKKEESYLVALYTRDIAIAKKAVLQHKFEK